MQMCQSTRNSRRWERCCYVVLRRPSYILPLCLPYSHMAGITLASPRRAFRRVLNWELQPPTLSTFVPFARFCFPYHAVRGDLLTLFLFFRGFALISFHYVDERKEAQVCRFASVAGLTHQVEEPDARASHRQHG